MQDSQPAKERKKYWHKAKKLEKKKTNKKSKKKNKK